MKYLVNEKKYYCFQEILKNYIKFKGLDLRAFRVLHKHKKELSQDVFNDINCAIEKTINDILGIFSRHPSIRVEFSYFSEMLDNLENTTDESIFENLEDIK